jgi:hypothetical protein
MAVLSFKVWPLLADLCPQPPPIIQFLSVSKQPHKSQLTVT